MQQKNNGVSAGVRWGKTGGLIAALFLFGSTSGKTADPFYMPPEWNFSGGLGLHFFEGDQETKHGVLSVLQAGYDLNDSWTLEGTLSFLPYLRANRVWSQSEQDHRPGLHEDTDSTWATGLAVDGRYHFTRQYRLDPFLSIGAGGLLYGHDRKDGANHDLAFRVGLGAFYYFNETLALRFDLRGMRVLNIGQANAQATLGIAWTPGGRPLRAFQVMGGVLDSDGDGLSDWEEIHIYFTDPYDPDTDGDGLSDFDELHRYGTDPLNPDTDGDGLSDYEEIFLYGTDPLKRDTDGGGVDDWHEIMVDGTDPLDPTDDLQLHTLHLQFDYDQAIIRSEFYGDLNVIGLTLSRDPDSIARIEGHADKLQQSDPEYNRELSKRRARAVKQYLVDNAGIASERLQAVGYGFQRPKEPNDPIHGNPVNRRVEIYIRTGEHIERYGVQPGLAPLPGESPMPFKRPLPPARSPEHIK